MTIQFSPQSQCWGKIRYGNKKEAKRAIKAVEASWGERLRAYHCPYDRDNNHYHIGHPIQQHKKEQLAS